MTAGAKTAAGAAGLHLRLVAALTLANAGCGFAGVILLGTEPSLLPAGLVFAAWGFDMADGPVARRLGVSSRFGAVLDSLADAVSFGVLPALLVATADGIAGRLAGGAYLAAALVRLARFTAAALKPGTRPPPARPRVFAGLPSPAAAMAVASVTLLGGFPGLLPLTGAIAAGLMVSPLPYVDLVDLVASRRALAWAGLVPVGLALAFGIPTALSLFFAGYLLSGPVLAAMRSAR